MRDVRTCSRVLSGGDTDVRVLITIFHIPSLKLPGPNAVLELTTVLVPSIRFFRLVQGACDQRSQTGSMGTKKLGCNAPSRRSASHISINSGVSIWSLNASLPVYCSKTRNFDRSS